MFKKALMIAATASMVFAMSGADVAQPMNMKMMKRTKQMNHHLFL